MSGTISGNVVTASEIIYLIPVGDYPVQYPQETISDGSGNYSFGPVPDGIYQIYSVKSFPSKVQVIVAGANQSNVNLSS